MSTYRKAEIEALVHACALHWGGQALDWWLMVEPGRHDASATIALQVELALDCGTRITTIALGNQGGPEQPAAALATSPSTHAHAGGAVAAVRRASVQALLAQSADGDSGALLGYLRCCGVLVMD